MVEDNHEDQFECDNCGQWFNQDDGVCLEHEEITLCERCTNETTVLVTQGRHNSATYCTETWAQLNAIQVNDQWYMDVEVLCDCGFVYCEYDDTWYESDGVEIVSCEDTRKYYPIFSITHAYVSVWFDTKDCLYYEEENPNRVLLREIRGYFDSRPVGMDRYVWNAMPTVTGG